MASPQPPKSRPRRGQRPPRPSAEVRRARAARRRAERLEFRRFTVPTRRRRASVVAAISALVTLLFAVTILTTSPIFSVRQMTIDGLVRLDEGLVRESLAEFEGQPMGSVEPGDVERVLATFPLVREVVVRIDLPSTLVISITERKALGAVASPAGFDVVDREAVVLWSTGSRPTELPVILVPADPQSNGFLAVGRALEALPGEVLARVDAVTATSQDTVRLSLRDSQHQVLWGSAENSESKARALPAALAAAGSEGSKLIDLSTPDTVVIRDGTE